MRNSFKTLVSVLFIISMCCCTNFTVGLKNSDKVTSAALKNSKSVFTISNPTLPSRIFINPLQRVNLNENSRKEVAKNSNNIAKKSHKNVAPTADFVSEADFLREDSSITLQHTELAANEQLEAPAFSASGEVNGVQVVVTANEGVFPEGTTMTVEAIPCDVEERIVETINSQADDENNVVDIAAVDITFYFDGEEIQPNGEVFVSMKTATLEGNSHNIFHASNSGANVNIIADASATGASFSADSFSIYAIVGTGTADEQARRFYSFYLTEEAAANDEPFNNQIIKNGETPIEPQRPDNEEGNVFKGWYLYEGGIVTDTALDFTKAVDDLSKEKGDEYVSYVAKYEAQYIVRFVDNTHDGLVVNTIVGTFDETGNASVSIDEINAVKIDVANAGATEGQAQTGWKRFGIEEKLTADITIQRDANEEPIVLYPYFESASWLIFDSNDDGTHTATIIAPQYILPDETTKEPGEMPRRAGYVFGGWYADADCTTEYAFGQTISENVTVYAKWNPGEAKYAIVVMKEVLPDDYSHDVYTDGKFDIARARWGEEKRIIQTAKASTEVTVASSQLDNYGITIPNYYQFHSATTENVRVDGMTEVYVYLRLREYTYTFDFKDNTGVSSDSDPGNRVSTLSIGGNTYKTKEYKITAVKDENISERWPNPMWVTSKLDHWYSKGEKEKNAQCYAWQTEKKAPQITMVYNFTADLIPDSQKTTYTATALFGGSQYREVHYWLQDENGEYYDEYTPYAETVLSTGSMSGKELTGFTYQKMESNDRPDGFDRNGNQYPKHYAGTSSGKINNKAVHIDNLYYDRNGYTVIFQNEDGEELKRTGEGAVKYGALIMNNPTVNDVLSKSYTRDGYRFLGWYEVLDGALTKIDPDTKKMPGNDLVLRQKWEELPTSIVFDADGGAFETGVTEFTVEVPKNEKYAGAIPSVTRDGYEFGGWVYADGANVGQPFNFAQTSIIAETRLKATWIPLGGIQIRYHWNGLDETDPFQYAVNRKVILRGAPAGGTTDSYFIGWSLYGSSVIKESYIEVTSGMVVDGFVDLYANYTQKPGNVTITYYPNYPDESAPGEPITERLDEDGNARDINNSAFTLKTPDELQMEVKSGLEFAGWNTNPNATSVLYEAGTPIGADFAGENALYAIWKAKLHYDANGGTGTMQDSVSVVFTTVTVKANEFTRTGYQFAGWNTAANGSGDSYSPGESYYLTLGTDILYAQWVKIIDITCYNDEESITKGTFTAETCTSVEIEGVTYETVLINGHCWMKENMRTASDNSLIYSTSKNPANEEAYGRLYLHEDAVNLCPQGWHLPTFTEIVALSTFSSEELRSDEGWIFNGNNLSGFSAQAAGFFNSESGRYERMHGVTYFHSESEDFIFSLDKSCCAIRLLPNSPSNAYSIRCVKDSE